MKDRMQQPSARIAALVIGLIAVVALFHFQGTSVYEEWAHGSLFIWLHCVWKFDSVGAVSYTYSYAVPLISAWFVWRDRHLLQFDAWRESWTGVAVLAIALLAHGVALRGELPHLSAVAFIGALWALPAALGGRRVAKVLAFPACYLVFAIPLSFIERATFPLRHAASVLSAILLNGLNLPVVRVGTALHAASGRFSLDVADPCSGIRSMLALVALGGLFARLARLTKTGKVLLFASCLPIALVANVVRIVLLAFVAQVFGSVPTEGIGHDMSGYIVFVVAALLLPITERLLAMRFRAEPEPSSDERASTTPQAPVRWSVVAALGALLLLSAPYAYKMENISVLTATPVEMEFPERVGGWQGERVYFSADPSVSRMIRESEIGETHVCPETGAALASASQAERLGLPEDTEIIKSVYEHPSGNELIVNIVRSGETRGSIHRPQWCIAAQGFSILSTSFPAWRNRGDKKVALLKIERAHGRLQTYYCYWFIGHDYSTPYHTSRVLRMALDRLLKGHSTRWAYVAISAPASSNAETFIAEFVRDLDVAITKTETSRR